MTKINRSSLIVAAFVFLAVLPALVAEISHERQLPANIENAPLDHSSLPQIVGDQPVAGAQARAGGVFTLEGDKVAAWSEDKKWPIASLTKLMTIVVAGEKIPSDKVIQINKEHIDLNEGFYAGFNPGEQYSAKDLTKTVLMISSNVAAEALAGDYGRDRFIAEMNVSARAIGLRDTAFFDPSGLSIKNQSTIEDLAKLVVYILKNRPDIFTVTREEKAVIYEMRSGAEREIVNINKFAGRADFIGGKTGTTPEAVGNLISVFRTRPGEGKIIILLGSENRFDETQNLLQK